MPNEYLDKVNLNGTTYDIKDTISGYTTNTGTVTSVAAGTGLSGGTITSSGTISLDTTRALTTSDITTGTDTTNKLVSAKTIADALSGFGGGTVTSVGITNGGGLSISGSPITSSGNITVGHSNSVTAQTTQAVYPIAIDAQGHISSYGTAVDIPTPETFLVNATITTVSAGGIPTGGTTDKSATEIYNAAASGLIPLVKVPMQTSGMVYIIAPLALTGNENDSVYARFVYEDQSNPTFQYATLQVMGNAFTIEFSPPYLKSGGAGMGGLSIENQDGTLDITHPDFVNNEIIAIDHQILGTEKTTQAVYPITIDNFGHIQSAGTAVTIPTVNNGALKLQKNTGTASSIYTANQSGDSTLKFTTTSVGSASDWSAGTVPTLGDNIPADDITAWTTNTPTTPATVDTTKFNGGSFTGGSFSGGSFTQGTDSFTANTPTTIDTTKFSGGSFTRGAFSGGSFTQGTDSFTTNTPTTIDTSKFNAGSYTQGTFSAGSLSMSGGGSASSSPATLTISFTAPTHASDSFTAPSLGSGFYSAGTAATFSQGADSFTAATHGNDSFTAASLNAGFYSAGTAATFTQGTDSFTAATHGNDSFTPASLSTGFYTAGTKGSSASLSYTAKSIPNVTGVGTAPSLTVSSTTVVNDITTV